MQWGSNEVIAYSKDPFNDAIHKAIGPILMK
jgi:hypothetical protein